MARSTRSARKPHPSTAPTILLRGKSKPLPSYLSIKHYPRHGIRSNTNVNTNVKNEAAVPSKKRPRTSLSPQKASHLKSKKHSALQSTFSPTEDEVFCHGEYLNCECVQLLSTKLDAAVVEVLRHCRGGRMGDECRGFFGMFSPDGMDDDDETNDVKDVVEHELNVSNDAAGVGEDTNVSMEKSNSHHVSFKPEKYSPTLLPVVIIKCYPSLLDRSEIVRGMVHDLSRVDSDIQNVGEQRRSCVCVMRSGADLVLQGSLVAELFFQCLANDPNGQQFNKHVVRQRKRQKSNVHGGIANGILFKSIFSYTESLIEWASCTEDFDEIVVIFEDPENIPSPNLDTFITTLSSLRSNHGVPINAIVMKCTPGGLGDRLSNLRHSTFQGGMGEGGMMQRVLSMPLPEEQLEMFVNELSSQNCMPCSLWHNDTLLNYIQNVFHEFDNSIVGTARRLKTEFIRYFSQPGAFTSLLDHPELTLPNWDRISWMTSQSATTPQDGKSRFQLTTKFTVSLAFRHVFEAISSIESSKSCNENGMMNLLKRLDQARAVLSKDATNSDEHINSIITEINKFIISIGKIMSDEECDRDIVKALLDNIKDYSRATTCKTLQTNLPKLSISTPPQPCQDIVKALTSSSPNTPDNSLVQAMRIAYQSFECRRISLSVWYGKYFDIVTDQPTMSSSESLFFVAVRELVHCGLIRRLTSFRRKDEAYEKIIGMV